MAKELRLRRGDTAASDAFIGSSAELTVDTQKKQVRLHDGITPGGFPLVKEAEMAGADGSNKVGYTSTGLGATTRRAQEKLEESLSVLDYGASPTNTAAVNTVAIQAALNAAVALNIWRVYVPAGTYYINATLSMHKECSLIGAGRSKTTIRATTPVRIFEWYLGSGFSGVISNISFHGGNIATEGLLIGAGADYRVDHVEVLNVAGRGIVMHTTQNTLFTQVQMQNNIVNLYLTNGVWNCIFLRCEFNAPTSYDLLSENDSTYVTLTGQTATSSGNSNRHNQFNACIFERGTPIDRIKFVNDAGENSFIACEIFGGSTGGRQFNILTGDNNFIGLNTTLQRGTVNLVNSITNAGYGLRIDGCIGSSWSGRQWLNSSELVSATNLSGDLGSATYVLNSTKKGYVDAIEFIGGGTYRTFNGVIKITNFSSDTRPRVIVQGDIKTQSNNSYDIGEAGFSPRAIYSNKYYIGSVSGVSGSFTSVDGKTVTVTGGLVTSIV